MFVRSRARARAQVQLVDVNGLPMEIDESRITEVHGAAVCDAAFNETSQLLCTCARSTAALDVARARGRG